MNRTVASQRLKTPTLLDLEINRIKHHTLVPARLTLYLSQLDLVPTPKYTP